MTAGWDEPEKLAVLGRRLDLLRRLRESPAPKRDLIDDLDQSRSTVDRAVSELEGVDLVERAEGGIALTTGGRVMLEWFETFQEGFDDVVDAQQVLAPLPGDADIGPPAVVGGDALLADAPTSYRPTERLHDALADAERYRAALPSLDDPRHVRLLYEHVVTRDRPAEVVVPPGLLQTFREEFPRRSSVLADSDGFDLLVGEVPPFALALVDSEGRTMPSVYVLVFTESGAVHGGLVNRSPSAVRWGEDRYAAVRDDAEDRVEALTADTDGGVMDADGGMVRPTLGRSLPVSLEREGFVRLDAGYFREAPVAEPTAAWRAGLTIPEVHIGYAVERPLEPGGGDEVDSPALSASLRARLEAGEDCVLVGPPGSGKSTTCKRVACEWYDADRGPVLYRPGGRGRPFESVADLALAVDVADGHALVVAEDAVRPEADAVFDAVELLGDREDVSFLLDAREHEWRDPPGDPADVDGLEVESMPPLAERDVERLVEHVEHTVGEPVEVPAGRLHEEVRDEVVTEAEAAPGEVLLLAHRLAAHVDPLAEGRTSLEDAVAAVYEDLADDDLALDVYVLANVLSAAGLEVEPGALYAVAAPGEETAVDAAIESLAGRVLFPREDGGYRTVHESWSVALLAHLLSAEGGAAAADRFGRVVSALLSLAGDPERCDRIAGHLDDRGALSAVVEEPGRWADEAVEAVYALARRRPKVAPLFGDGNEDVVTMPDGCSPEVAQRRPAWLGEAFEAGGYYDRAEQAFERLPEDGHEPKVDRLLGLASVAISRGSFDDAADHAEQSLAMLDQDGSSDRGDRGYRTRARLLLGEAASGMADYDDAAEHYRAAIAGFEAVGDRRRLAVALNDLAGDAYRQREYERAREYLERALDIRRELGDRRGQAESFDTLGVVARERGEYDRARECHERGLALAREVGDRNGEASNLNNLAISFDLVGDHDRSVACFERALALYREVGDPIGAASSLGNLGKVAQNRGDYEAAAEYFLECRHVARDIGDSNLEGLTLRNLGEVTRVRGQYGRAREYLSENIDISEEVGDRQGRANGHKNLGLIALRQGDLEDAHDRFERSLSMAEEMGHLREETTSLRGMGEVTRRRGDLDEAREHLDRALDRIQDVDDPAVRGRIQLSRARLALDTGDLVSARERATDARSTFEESDANHWAARCRRLLGRIEADAGDPEAAREHWRAALETFEAVGAPQDVLLTLRHLLESAVEEDQVRDWCRRSEAVLETAPETVVEQHSGWVSRRCEDADGE